MRFACMSFVMFSLLAPALAQEKPEGPTDERGQKTYKQAMDAVHENRFESALGDFKKADKQDGGHCLGCQKQMIKLGIEFSEWKTAEMAAEEMLAEAQGEKATAIAHYEFAWVLMKEGAQKHKDEFFSRAHEEAAKALDAYPHFPDALFLDGEALARIRQDDAAIDRFRQYVKLRPTEDPDHQRALRYIARPELARARMSPPFTITTIDGQRISMDDLQGKVVLLDFWATWCLPCREALPHIQQVAKKFQGQPLVILSVSLDSDERKWKEFIGKNEMTWPQYRDGGFTGPVAKIFAVTAIPHTFTIDADGVLQEEHIGDTSIEGKLKKLIARVNDSQPTKTPTK
jgi:thiol-disulfide isomerase/thioredoxin